MKNRIFPALVCILLFFTGCTPKGVGPAENGVEPIPSPAIEEITSVLDHPFDDLSLFAADLRPEDAQLVERFPEVDIYHLDVYLADDLTSLTGSMKVRYTNRLDTPLDELVFRLLPNLWGDLMKVNSSVLADESPSTTLENKGTVLRIPLRQGLTPGGSVELELTFTVTIPQDESGNYGTFGNQAGVLALAQFYPLIPLRDDQGWRTELYPPNGDVTVAEVANYLVRISAPEALILTGSGIQVDRSTLAGRQTITYVAALAREFYLVGSPGYEFGSTTEDGIRYTIYSQPDVASTAGESLDTLAHAAAIFSQRLGNYPYRELDCAATPTSAAGVEYPGIMAINQLLFDPDASLSGMSSRDLVESVIVHEVAHEWFYNIVGNDQAREPWLDEALAQYLTYAYFLDRYGQGAANGYRSSWSSRWDRVNRAAVPIGMPVEYYHSREYGAIVYGRGPLFLDELSKTMGQAVFDSFLRKYFETYSWKVATGADFQSLAEATCSCDLEPLFNEWVYMK